MGTQSSPNSAEYFGLQDEKSASSDLNALEFVFRRLMTGIWTSALVQVKAVTNAGELSPVGFVDVQPLVHQIDGAGQKTEHGVIHHLPYFRLQGGTDAVILDPKVDDLGLAIIASRDISAVKSTRGPNVPGSRRMFNPADGLYIGGFLNGVPQQYVRFSSAGIEMVSPTQIKLQAPDIQFAGPTHTTGAVTGDSTATFSGEVEGNGVHLSGHHHPGVQSGTSNTGTATG